MATRRRPNSPTPVTEVVARPVSTFVNPGNVGMPQAPVAPMAPKPIGNQEAVDLQNLSQSFGQLSRSLQDLGQAQYTAEQRELAQQKEAIAEQRRQDAEQERLRAKAKALREEAEALKRRQQADADREAAKKEAEALKIEREAAKQEREAIKRAERGLNRISIVGPDGRVIPLDKMKDQVSRFVEEGKAYRQEHMAFREAMSVGLAKKYAVQHSLSDSSELDDILAKGGDELLNKQWFSKWWSSRTQASLDKVPDWIEDNDAYEDTYRVARAELSAAQAKKYHRRVSELQGNIEARNLQDGVDDILARANDPNDLTPTKLEFNEETFELEEVEDDGEQLTTAYSRAVGQVEQLINDQVRAGTLTKTAVNTLVGETLLNSIDSRRALPGESALDVIKDIDFRIRVLKGVETGPPDSRAKLLGNNELGRKFRERNGVEERAMDKVSKLMETHELQVWQQGVNTVVEKMGGQYFSRLEDKMPMDEMMSRSSMYLDQLLNQKEGAQLEDDDVAFGAELEALGATFDADSGTLTFKHKDGKTKETHRLEDIAVQMKSDLIGKRVAEERSLAGVKAEEGISYTDHNGNPLPEEDLDMITRARVVRLNNFNEDKGVKAFVERIRTDPGDTIDERARNLSTRLYIYKELTSDTQTNPSLAKDVLGDDSFTLLRIIEALDDTYTLPNLSQKITSGVLSEEYRNIQLNANEGELKKKITDRLEHTKNKRKFENYFYSGISPTVKQEASFIASVLSASFGMDPVTATDKAVDMLYNEGVEAGKIRLSPEYFSKRVATGTHPSMKFDPTWIPPTPLERETIATQVRKLETFENALKAYSDHYAAFPRGRATPYGASYKTFGIQEDPAKIKKWRAKLFKLENDLRAAEGKPPREADDDPNSRAFPSMYRATSKFSVDVLRKDPGSMTGGEMLALASEGLNAGSSEIQGDVAKALIADIYNSFVDPEDLEFFFIPDSQSNENILLMYKDQDGVMQMMTRREGRANYFTIDQVAELARSSYYAKNPRPEGPRLPSPPKPVDVDGQVRRPDFNPFDDEGPMRPDDPVRGLQVLPKQTTRRIVDLTVEIIKELQVQEGRKPKVLGRQTQVRMVDLTVDTIKTYLQKETRRQVTRVVEKMVDVIGEINKTQDLAKQFREEKAKRDKALTELEAANKKDRDQKIQTIAAAAGKFARNELEKDVIDKTIQSMVNVIRQVESTQAARQIIQQIVDQLKEG